MVLVGGPGSKANHLGAALVQRYGGNLISAVDVLHNASLTSTNARACLKDTPGKSQHINPLNQMEMLAPKELRDIMLTRLSQDDVRTGGFVLVGYPFNRSQADHLKKSMVWIRNAIHLELKPAAAEAAVCGSRLDPYDGELYHVDGAMPTDEDARARLLIHPNHKPAVVKNEIAGFQSCLAPLLTFFEEEGILSTEDATRSESEILERLAPCFLSL